MPDFGLPDYSSPGVFSVCQGQSRQRRCEASFTYTGDYRIIQATIQHIFLATSVTKMLDHNITPRFYIFLTISPVPYLFECCFFLPMKNVSDYDINNE